MQSPPFPRYLVPPRSKYSPQHHILKPPQLPLLPQCRRPGFTPIQNNRQNYSSIFWKYIFSDLKPCGYVPLGFILKESYVERVKTCRLLLVPVRFIWKNIYVLSLYSVYAFFMNLRGKNECIQMQCMFVFIIPRRSVFSVRYEINLTSLVV